MTTVAVLAQGMQVSSKAGSVAQVAWRMQSTQARWVALQATIQARRAALRSANLRARRRAGLPLHPLPVSVVRRKGKARVSA